MINENIVKQMPVLAPDHICPVCKCLVSQLDDQKVALYNASLTEFVTAIHRFYYCENCGLPYSDKAINKILKKENEGYHLCCLSIGKNLSIQEINEKMLEGPLPNKPKPKKKHNKKRVPLLNTNIESVFGYKVIHRKIDPASIIKKIVLLPAKIDECPFCYSTLHPGYVNAVLIAQPDVYAKVEGKCCFKCNTFYYPENSGPRIKRLLNYNDAKEYNLVSDIVEDEQFKKYLQYRKYIYAFDGNADYKVFLVAKNKESGELLPIVISNQVIQGGEIPNTLCYKFPETRKLLLEIAYKGKTEFDYHGAVYSIAYQKVKEAGGTLNQLCNIVKNITFKQGGGLVSYDSHLEIVDILLYSPFTDNLEISRATYNKNTNTYYMDVSLFKNFLRRYGNPQVEVRYIPHHSNFNDLADESLLHAYGYNVNSQENLSNATRQGMIRDVIDLGWMTQTAVINLLKYNIFTHKQHKAACEKWETDIYFTERYQAHPDRFIIGKPSENEI